MSKKVSLQVALHEIQQKKQAVSLRSVCQEVWCSSLHIASSCTSRKQHQCWLTNCVDSCRRGDSLLMLSATRDRFWHYKGDDRCHCCWLPHLLGKTTHSVDSQASNGGGGFKRDSLSWWIESLSIYPNIGQLVAMNQPIKASLARSGICYRNGPVVYKC